ncbi:Fc.00g050030.m01.CDS01 [Cosmosporella sp. VM-42]
MTLSTVDERGWPDARVLILKNVDSRGWHFAVNADSPKGQQIAENSHVALTFYWPQIGRQIRLRGVASRLPDAECVQDFTARPLGSKVSAMATKQSRVLHDRDELLRAVDEAQKLMEEEPDQVLPKWTVYAVAPDVVEFWQGATDRLHKRLQYVPRRSGGEWQKQLLWP